MFEAGHFAFAVCNDILFGNFLFRKPGLADDDRGYAFAPFGIRQSDDGAFKNTFMISDNFFDLTGIDIFPTRYNHVLFAVHKMIEAVFVAFGHIAGRKPLAHK